jgi:hypothetical protein
MRDSAIQKSRPEGAYPIILGLIAGAAIGVVIGLVLGRGSLLHSWHADTPVPFKRNGPRHTTTGRTSTDLRQVADAVVEDVEARR